MKKLFTAVIVLILFLSVEFRSQDFSVGPGIGFTALSGKDSYTTSISENGLGFGTGFTYGGKIRFEIPLTSVSITANFLYSKFGDEGIVDFPQFPLSDQIDRLNITTSGSLFQASLGSELGLIPGPVTPYATFDVLVSSFGKVDYEIQDYKFAAEEIKSRARFGIGLGGGIDFALTPNLSFDVSAKYNFNNLIGKEEEEKSINSILIFATLQVDLN